MTRYQPWGDNQTLRNWTDTELRDHAQGCTETTCPYHGRFNEELRRRG